MALDAQDPATRNQGVETPPEANTETTTLPEEDTTEPPADQIGGGDEDKQVGQIGTGQGLGGGGVEGGAIGGMPSGQAKTNPPAVLPKSPLGTDYRITSPYKEKRKDGSEHGGVDIKRNDREADPIVRAAGGGTVVDVSANNGKKSGDYITIQTDDGYTEKYYHTNGVVYGLERGDKITEGQTIGEYNKSGDASGPHLHFEVEHDGQKIDPMEYLKQLELKHGNSGQNIKP